MLRSVNQSLFRHTSVIFQHIVSYLYESLDPISNEHLVNSLYSFVSFVIGVIISSIIIYFVTKLFGEKEGIKTAIITAVIGAIVYSIAYFLLGNGFWAAIAGGFVWLLMLKALYSMGWLKAFVIALIVWIAAAITGILLPTAPGPL